jgi:hypothetical protein
VKCDVKQWAAWSGESDPTADAVESGTDDARSAGYRSDSIGNAIRLIDVLRNAITSKEIVDGSKGISTMVGQLYWFQVAALSSADELRAAILLEHGKSRMSTPGGPLLGTEIPGEEQVRSIKSQ